MSKNKNKGSTLIEILIAVFVLGMSLTALVSLTTMSISRNRMAKEKAVATRLAQEGMDWMVSERNRLGFGKMGISDTDIGEIYCINGLGEINFLASGVCAENFAELYRRELTITGAGDDQVQYSVSVNWGDQEVVLNGTLTRWDKVD